MRIRQPRKTDDSIGDLTPMIDMTFQLIAFFMVLINFSEADHNQSVQLPMSTLAKPPDGPPESPVYIHMKESGDIVYGGDDLSLDQLAMYLKRERELLKLDGKTPAAATVIIRADAAAATGKVQELIQVCQDEKFENFALRAKEDVGG